MVFKLGTGWLGWTPQQTLHTPLPQLFLALEGRVDFLRKTNPFGGGPEKKKPVDPEVLKKHQIAFDAITAKAKSRIGKMKRD